MIPCITVRRGHRGRGVAIAMIRAAVAYAASRGAHAVEAYPRTETTRLHDDFAFYGTEAMFRKAGFRRVRGPLAGLPKNWTPRVAMRANLVGRRHSRPRDLAAQFVSLWPTTGAVQKGLAAGQMASPRLRAASPT